MARIGLLGGSFNPAHQGHKNISLNAIEALALDAVWWLVSPGNPLKAGASDMAPFDARFASARELAEGAPIVVSDIECRLGTRFTMEQPFHVDRLRSHGIDVLVPEADDLTLVHDVIYDELVLGVVRDASREAYVDVVRRLVGRGTESQHERETRLATATRELAAADEFDVEFFSQFQIAFIKFFNKIRFPDFSGNSD